MAKSRNFLKYFLNQLSDLIGDAVVADSAELVKVVVSVKYVGWSIMGVVVVSF